jgi:E3 ubiquitin-protein ligase RGLG
VARTQDDKLPARKFDNFQFVDFFEVTSPERTRNPMAYFAMNALMEIPEQFQAIRKMGMLDGRNRGGSANGGGQRR